MLRPKVLRASNKAERQPRQPIYRSGHRKGRPARVPFRPWVMALEDRCLPSLAHALPNLLSPVAHVQPSPAPAIAHNHGGNRLAGPSEGAFGTIGANPNPVVVPPGRTGTTTVSWYTSNTPTASVYESINGGSEFFVAGGPSGSVPVEVQYGSTYIFTLYAGSHEQFLDSTSVATLLSPWGYEDLGGATLPGSTTTTVVRGTEIHVFARGLDSQLWEWWQDSSGWHGPQALGGALLATNPVAVARGNWIYIVAGRQGDNTLFGWAYDGGVLFSGVLGGAITSDPAIVARGDVEVDVFGRGLDNQLYRWWWDGGERWMVSGGLGGNLASSPAAVSRGQDIWVVARNQPGDNLGTWYYNGTNWFNRNLAGPFASTPTIVTRGPLEIDVFGRRSDNALVTWWYDGAFWYDVGVVPGSGLASDPTAVVWGPSRMEILGGSAIGQPLDWWWDDASAWHGPVDMGGTLTSPLSGVRNGSNRLDVFYRGPGGNPVHRWLELSSAPDTPCEPLCMPEEHSAPSGQGGITSSLRMLEALLDSENSTQVFTAEGQARPTRASAEAQAESLTGESTLATGFAALTNVAPLRQIGTTANEELLDVLFTQLGTRLLSG